MSSNEPILENFRKQIFKGIEHLVHSYQKVLKLDCDVEKLNTNDLESWESFVARFARVSDIFLSKLKNALLSEFKKRMGDRKIDFSVFSFEQAIQDTFYKEILPKSILLKKW